MWKQIMKRITRQPLMAAAVILFAAVLTIVLCFLHQVRMDEQQAFDKSYASIPVFFKITDLDGSRVTDTGGIKGWIVDLLTDTWLQPNLSSYVRELHIRVTYDDALQTKMVWLQKRGWIPMPENIAVTGISSTLVAEELTAGWGGSIQWFEGYDESILSSDEFVLIVPENCKDEQEIKITFKYQVPTDGSLIIRETTHTFRVVGYYVDPGNTRYYCPYPTIEWIYAKLGRSKIIEEIGAILIDNTQMTSFREDAAYWFAEPNPAGKPTPWGRFDFDYYLYALDIDDNMLRGLETEMKNSMRINQFASFIVFLLSAGAGFLTGFLVIRSRKREILLMRTLGSSDWSIYRELALEQLLCMLAGIVIGGGYSLWQPIWQLLLFSSIYFVGLSAALIAFMRANLLTNLKEEK